MSRFLATADGALRKIEWGGIAIAAIAFAAMMLVTVVDVISRYLMNAPLTWSFDLITGYLLVAGFFLAISAAQASRQHVNIDILARMLPRRLRAGLLAPAYLFAIVFVFVVAWAAASEFLDAWSNNLVVDGVIPWPRWPTYLLAAAGAGLLALRLTLDGLTLAGIAAGRESGADPFAHEQVAGSE